MAAERANDPKAFHDYLGGMLATEGAGLTLDEALTSWEIENQPGERREETLEAIRRGLADVDAGRTRPAEDVMNDLRRKYNLPDPTQ